MWIYEQDSSNLYCHAPLHNGFGERSNCVGMKCMAWRWGYINKVDDPKYTGQSYSAAEVGVPETAYPENQRFRARKGYCGLAGKPTS